MCISIIHNIIEELVHISKSDKKAKLYILYLIFCKKKLLIFGPKEEGSKVSMQPQLL